MLYIVTESKAKILGKKIKSYVLGQPFEIGVGIKNIGKNVVKDLKFSFSIIWSNQQRVTFESEEPIELLPNKGTIGQFESNAMAHGYGLFMMGKVKDNTSNVNLFDINSKPLKRMGAIHTIYAKTGEEVFSYYALIVASISLVIIALEKLYPFFLWFLQSIGFL